MKVLGIVGSRRRNGNTELVVKEALRAIESKDVETNLISLGDYNFKGCIGCEGCRDTYKCVIKDDMQKLYPLILEADALILGSPTYFYNITADMKAFIERLYCYEVFDEEDRSVWMSVNEALGGKHAVVIAICEQETEDDMGYTAKAMSKSLEALGYRVVDTVKILKSYKKGDVLQVKDALDTARKAAIKLEKTIRLKEKIKKNLKDL